MKTVARLEAEARAGAIVATARAAQWPPVRLRRALRAAYRAEFKGRYPAWWRAVRTHLPGGVRRLADFRQLSLS